MLLDFQALIRSIRLGRRRGESFVGLARLLHDVFRKPCEGALVVLAALYMISKKLELL